jgi:hypothetical protein
MVMLNSGEPPGDGFWYICYDCWGNWNINMQATIIERYPGFNTVSASIGVTERGN